VKAAIALPPIDPNALFAPPEAGPAEAGPPQPQTNAPQ